MSVKRERICDCCLREIDDTHYGARIYVEPPAEWWRRWLSSRVHVCKECWDGIGRSYRLADAPRASFHSARKVMEEVSGEGAGAATRKGAGSAPGLRTPGDSPPLPSMDDLAIDDLTDEEAKAFGDALGIPMDKPGEEEQVPSSPMPFDGIVKISDDEMREAVQRLRSPGPIIDVDENVSAKEEGQ